ncbi:MAG: molybdate ABC transporter ATP-binding protein ModF [Desulfobacterales bacterium]|nr:molybdate ABC transporter ATP-binding protein ModF [Desulfobacterales bacterium]
MERSDSFQQPFITLKNVTLRIQDRLILQDTDWEILMRQHWAVLGPNGAGKSSLVKALTGELPVVKGNIIRHYYPQPQHAIGCVSFELEQRLIAHEEKQDDARYFSGNINTFSSAHQVLCSDKEVPDQWDANFDKIVDLLRIRPLLNRSIRYLSTGEMRKILIARALMRSPRLLILDEPFDGLDLEAKAQFADIINSLMTTEMQLVLVTHRFEEIVPNISQVLCVKNGAVFLKGPREKVLTDRHLDELFDRKPSIHFRLPEKESTPKPSAEKPPAALITMKKTTVRYGDLLVLDRLDWTMNEGENWAILGPNGSGKSTLLNLILGDNLQSYANEIYLFGSRKGSGETVWDIKKKIGIVSSGLQIHYRKRIKVYDVVLSGFFDSIGLYRHAALEQYAAARRWLEILGIPDKAEQRFDKLSYGERRMVLVARAMVKSPAILILDEPCQGLDTANRQMVLELVDYVGRETHTNLLYVTHHEDEIPACISHLLRLDKHGRTESDLG